MPDDVFAKKRTLEKIVDETGFEPGILRGSQLGYTRQE
jgi:hypothetical protein